MVPRPPIALVSSPLVPLPEHAYETIRGRFAYEPPPMLAARQRRARRVGFLVRGDNPPAAAVQAVAEGVVLAAFSGERYKSGERGAPPRDEIIIAAPGAERTTVDAAAHRGPRA